MITATGPVTGCPSLSHPGWLPTCILSQPASDRKEILTFLLNLFFSCATLWGMTTTTEAENTKLRKGDKALWVRSYARNGVCTFSVAPIEITSWGAKQGTPIGPKSGKNALVRFYTDQNPMRGQWVFKNMAEIEAFAAQYGPQWAETSRKGSLNCEESDRKST